MNSKNVLDFGKCSKFCKSVHEFENIRNLICEIKLKNGKTKREKNEKIIQKQK